MRSGPVSSTASTSTPGKASSTLPLISRSSVRSLSCTLAIRSASSQKMGATRPFRQAGEMWSGQDSNWKWAVGPAQGGAAEPLDGCRALRRVRLQMTDHVGDVGQFLLEVALVLLEPAQPLLPVREGAPPAAEAAVVMSVSVHVHLPSS